MRKLLNHVVIKNKRGQVRSGWIVFIAMAAFYALSYGLSDLVVEMIRRILIATGDLDPAAGYYSALVDWMNDVFLPIALQILTDVIMIAVPVLIWRYLMKHRVREMGLISVKAGWKEGVIGMALGAVCCTLIFTCLILTGQGRVESWKPVFSDLQLWWLFLFLLVAFAEEILNRSFLMSVLRRTGNRYLIVLVPSVLFGLIHCFNPGVTVFSVINIILAGVLFSYMFIKSGNIWMCIGYHFTWNAFQGLVYGMPVSGLNVPGIITTHFQSDGLLTGGAFGIEGGILTTIILLLGFLFVKYYYSQQTRCNMPANGPKGY